MRIMAFDSGTKRIGVAASDETALIAAGIGYIEVNDNTDNELKKIVEEKKPGRLVVGRPLNMNGTDNPKTTFANELAERLKALFPEMEIVMWDERLTSMQANKMLISGGMRRDKRKETVDKVAAALILQNYLDFLKMRERNV